MFRKHSERLQRLLSLLDDVLGDAPEEAPPHPHRRVLAWQPARRGGSVAPRPAHCLSPIRPARAARVTRVREWVER
jgi:hypothetical protein